MIGEPDAGKPHVRFDEGVQETCDIAPRLHPTLPEPPIHSPVFQDGSLSTLCLIQSIHNRHAPHFHSHSG